MSESSTDDLVRLTHDLIASIDNLRDALLEYKEGCDSLLRADEVPGADSTIAGVALLKFGEKRARVTLAMDQFEKARREARVGLIAVAKEEGSNLSDVARALGVSRQLTSRLVKEAGDRGP